MYKGIIISESLSKPSIIKEFKVYKAKITEEQKPEDVWHMYWVKASIKQIKQLSKEIKQGWYTHFWNNKKEVRVIFKDKIFKFNFDKKETWKPAVEYGKYLGIPEYQLDFPIEE